jgi:hypothetical protein
MPGPNVPGEANFLLTARRKFVLWRTFLLLRRVNPGCAGVPLHSAASVSDAGCYDYRKNNDNKRPGVAKLQLREALIEFSWEGIVLKKVSGKA